MTDSTSSQIAPAALSPNQKLVDDRVISTNSIPFMREREVSFSATGMKPNTEVHAFFDGVEVTDDCKTENEDYGSPLITTAIGEIRGTLRIPNRPGKQFRTGSRLFRLTSSPTNKQGTEETYAEAVFVASGVLSTRQRTILSTRTVVVPAPAVATRPAPAPTANTAPASVTNPVYPTGSSTSINPAVPGTNNTSASPVNVYVAKNTYTFEATSLTSALGNDYFRFTAANVAGTIKISSAPQTLDSAGLPAAVDKPGSATVNVYQNGVLVRTQTVTNQAATTFVDIQHNPAQGVEYKVEFVPTSLPSDGRALVVGVSVAYPGIPSATIVPREVIIPPAVTNFVEKTQIVTYPRTTYSQGLNLFDSLDPADEQLMQLLYKRFSFTATTKGGTAIKIAYTGEGDDRALSYYVHIKQGGVVRQTLIINLGETKTYAHLVSNGLQYELTFNPFYDRFWVLSAAPTFSITYTVDEITQPPARAVDPLAQSFTVNTQDGGFVTGVQVFFAEVSSKANLTAKLELREMINGFPSTNVLPGGVATLRASEIVTSTDASASTMFRFAHPVYVQPNVEYCFVIKADSPDFKVWVAQMGESDIRTSTKVTKQPSTGVLFRSSNDTTWIADPLSDMTFNLMLARFTQSSGTISVSGLIPDNELTNDEFNPFFTVLLDNPFYTISGTANGNNPKIVNVYHKSHGYRIGDTVSFANIDFTSGATYNGIPCSEFNIARLILSVDVDHYTIEMDSAATITGFCGASGDTGVGIHATQAISFDSARLMGQQIVLKDTEIVWSAVTKDRDTNVTSTDSVEINKTSTFDETKIALQASDLTYNAVVTSDNSYVSPVVDLQRLSALLTRNRINSGLTFGKKYHTDLALPADRLNTQDIDDSVCRYLTKPVELDLAANSLRVLFNGNVRDNASFVDGVLASGSAILVYAKFQAVDSDQNVTDLDWIPLKQKGTVQPSTNQYDFSEFEFDMDSATLASYGISEYNVFQVKVVLLSTESARAPKFADFRAIATLE